MDGLQTLLAETESVNALEQSIIQAKSYIRILSERNEGNDSLPVKTSSNSINDKTILDNYMLRHIFGCYFLCCPSFVKKNFKISRVLLHLLTLLDYLVATKVPIDQVRNRKML